MRLISFYSFPLLAHYHRWWLWIWPSCANFPTRWRPGQWASGEKLTSWKPAIGFFSDLCLAYNLAWLFVQYQGWEFTLLDSSQVSNSLGWPAYRWMPDGHLSTLWVDNCPTRWSLLFIFGFLCWSPFFTLGRFLFTNLALAAGCCVKVSLLDTEKISP